MTSERDAARLEFEAMRKERLDLFMAGFSTITNKLKEMYQVSDAEVGVVSHVFLISYHDITSVGPSSPAGAQEARQWVSVSPQEHLNRLSSGFIFN